MLVKHAENITIQEGGGFNSGFINEHVIIDTSSNYVDIDRSTPSLEKISVARGVELVGEAQNGLIRQSLKYPSERLPLNRDMSFAEVFGLEHSEKPFLHPELGVVMTIDDDLDTPKTTGIIQDEHLKQDNFSLEALEYIESQFFVFEEDGTKRAKFERVIINGDFVDLWCGLFYESDWFPEINRIFSELAELGVEVIYVRGNHDASREGKRGDDTRGWHGQNLETMNNYLSKKRAGKPVDREVQVFKNIHSNSHNAKYLGDFGKDVSIPFPVSAVVDSIALRSPWVGDHLISHGHKRIFDPKGGVGERHVEKEGGGLGEQVEIEGNALAQFFNEVFGARLANSRVLNRLSFPFDQIVKFHKLAYENLGNSLVSLPSDALPNILEHFGDYYWGPNDGERRFNIICGHFHILHIDPEIGVLCGPHQLQQDALANTATRVQDLIQGLGTDTGDISISEEGLVVNRQQEREAEYRQLRERTLKSTLYTAATDVVRKLVIEKRHIDYWKAFQELAGKPNID